MSVLSAIVLLASAQEPVAAVNGHDVPQSQFVLESPDACCTTGHYGAANGSFVTATDGAMIFDPDPSACRFGLLTFAVRSSSGGGFDETIGNAVDLLTIAGALDLEFLKAAILKLDEEVDEANKTGIHKGPGGAPGEIDIEVPRGADVDERTLEFFRILLEAEVGERMVERFLDHRGELAIVLGTPGEGKLGIYSPAWNTITIARGAVDDRGRLRANPTVVSNVAHEFWHAYYDQIVEGGVSGAAADGFMTTAHADVVAWIPTTDLRITDTDTRVSAETLEWDLDEVADEYIGDIVEEVVMRYLAIAQRLREGHISREEARRDWEQAKRDIAGGHYEAYDSNTPSHTVTEPPPERVVRYVIDILLGVSQPF